MPKKNNLDIIRLVLASIVMVVHSYALSGVQSLKFVTRFLSSDIAVQGFFIISGFLIFRSYENTQNLKLYLENRARRIYPAYFFVVTCGAFFLYFASTLKKNYWSLAWLKYYLANITFLNFFERDLPGVFGSNPLSLVNGSLWTIKIEVMFYLSVPLIVLAILRLNKQIVLLSLFVFSVGYVHILKHLASVSSSPYLYEKLVRQLPGQLSYFIIGGAIYYFLPQFLKYRYSLLFFAGIAYSLESFEGIDCVRSIWLGILIFVVAFGPYLGNTCRFGDISYGVYLINFPIIQLLVMARYFEFHPFLSLVGTCAIVYLLSFLMWHLIEKRWLLTSSHYRKNEEAIIYKNKSSYQTTD